ncbi:MAG: hypothetical protein K8J08_09570, partial [Thermoanaerobaculia bacterium]|nr:hypothetical protein [Thermoanaerobaculia bacterium]
MRSRGLLVLAGLVLAVGAFIAFVERDLPTTDELAERADLLIDIDVDRVEKLVVSHGEETVTLERELTDEGEPSESEILGFGKPSVPWRMTAPLEAKADAGAVDAVLAQIAEVEKVRVLED